MCEQCEDLYSNVGRKFGIDANTIKEIIDAFVDEKKKVIQQTTGLSEAEVSKMLGLEQQAQQQPLMFEGDGIEGFMDFLQKNGLVAEDPKKKKDSFEYN